MDEQLREMVDEYQIRRLIMTWLEGIDSRRPELIISAWSDEMENEFIGFPDMGTGPISSGRHRTADRAPGLVKMISQFDSTQHVSTNHLITVDGDEATCSCYMVATHHLAMDCGEPRSVIGARYDIAAHRFDHGWRLTKLKWTRLWTSGNDALWAEVGKRLASEV